MHTPGPWRTDCKGFGYFVTSDNVKPSTIPGLIYPEIIARTDWDRGQEDNDNAHLVAAAPELLESLKRLVFYCDHDPKGWCEEAEKAIAKAEGKENQ